ncbi:MAG TPA: hypothetical protein VHJ77_07500 [Vicinamibacterales bacterium]|nr:hypothetical protein [Vicinamibacterales bacterium]
MTIPPDTSSKQDEIARQYVQLVLALGQHDPDYVDAYYGPPEWRAAAEQAKAPPEEIERRTRDVRSALAAVTKPTGEMERLRHDYLDRQLAALDVRLTMLRGKRLSFDEESRGLYDATAPVHTESYFAKLVADLDRRFPGPGPLAERYDKFRSAFVIPGDKLDAVFTAAIAECRVRTKKHIPLPPDEEFTIEYVEGKTWSAYNWYKGSFRSVIQVNTDLPVYVDRAIDLACHEGYPGHHVYNALLEKHLVKDRGWVEFSVYALFSPQSLIAEGTANFGIDVAFPGRDRLAFERDRLFPLAGLDPTKAEAYFEAYQLAERLSYAVNEAARRYLNGEFTAPQAAGWLERYGLMTRARAEQRVRFIDQYRSYVINYNLGEDLVRQYIEDRGGTADQPAKRWQEFAALLSSPRLPSGL